MQLPVLSSHVLYPLMHSPHTSPVPHASHHASHFWLPRDLFFGGQILDGSWNKLIDAGGGSVRPMRGEIHSFQEHSILLQSGEVVEADLVLYCTGYVKSYDYLDGSVKVGKLESWKVGGPAGFGGWYAWVGGM